MQAFHNDPSIKAKYLKRVQDHIDADNLIRGTGWSDGRGCAIGCTLEAFEHPRYETEIGIPVWLAHVEDVLFEGMSEEKSRSWPYEFLAAITPGDNLDRVKGSFMIIVLRSTLETFDHDRFPKVKSAIDSSIALWQRDAIGSNDWFNAAYVARYVYAARAADAAARAAADAAAYAAADAAYAAAYAAGAADAAYAAAYAAADAAARAAVYAARAAADAAYAAAYAADVTYDYFADELIRLFKEKS